MSGIADKLCFAGAVALTMTAFIQSPSAQNGGGGGNPAGSATYGNAQAGTQSPSTTASTDPDASAEAAMATEPALVTSPSQNGVGESSPAQSGTYGTGEMPNSMTAGSTLANAKADAAMAAVPNSTPMPFPIPKPGSNPNLNKPN